MHIQKKKGTDISLMIFLKLYDYMDEIKLTKTINDLYLKKKKVND